MCVFHCIQVSWDTGSLCFPRHPVTVVLCPLGCVGASAGCVCSPGALCPRGGSGGADHVQRRAGARPRAAGGVRGRRHLLHLRGHLGAHPRLHPPRGSYTGTCGSEPTLVLAPRKHHNLVWDESQLPAEWYDWKIAGSCSLQFSLSTAEQRFHAVHLSDVQICLSKDGGVMNYEMLVISLKVDEIIIYSKVFSRTRIILPEILPLVSSKKLRAIYVASGRVCFV